MARRVSALCFLVAFPVLGIAAPEFISSSSPNLSTQASPRDASHLPHRSAAAPDTPPFSGKPAKLHKWTGELVNAVCMIDALRHVPSIDRMLFPEILSQSYLQAVASAAQRPSQGTGSGAAVAQSTPQGPNSADEVGSNAEPETSERELAIQAAELQRADMLKEQVSLCAPHKPAAHFGIVVSGGYLLKFDAAGDLKTMQVLRAAMIDRGKVLKAKVTGAMAENADTIIVASVEIKGQIRPSRALFESGALH